eukprot:6477327-Amphidinium_carterae.4
MASGAYSRSGFLVKQEKCKRVCDEAKIWGFSTRVEVTLSDPPQEWPALQKSRGSSLWAENVVSEMLSKCLDEQWPWPLASTRACWKQRGFGEYGGLEFDSLGAETNGATLCAPCAGV